MLSEQTKRRWEYVLVSSLVEIKADASRNFLGILWWILEPLAYLAAFYLVFAVGFRTGGSNFLPFLLIGLVGWKWFATSIQTSSRAISGNAGLIRQIDIRKWTLIIAVILANLWKFLIILLLLLTFLVVYGYTPSLDWLRIVPVMLLQLILTAGISVCIATAMPFLPDLRFVVETGLFIAFVSAGVFFDISEWSADVRDVLAFHPMVWFLDAYRAVLMDTRPLEWSRLFGWGAFGALLLACGLVGLRRVEREIPRLL